MGTSMNKTAKVEKESPMPINAVETELKNETKVAKDTSERKSDIEEKLEKENYELKTLLSELSKKVESLSAVKPVETAIISSKMDRPCTLVHMVECIPQLPSTIRVNGVEVRFSRFGERRTFRFAEMQDITSRYADWFERGIFTLGEDCDEMVDDFGISIMSIPMSVEKHKAIASMQINEFKEIIKTLNYSQCLMLAKTWIQRYENGEYGYDNVEKIKILNTKTKGFMKGLMSDVLSEEQ